MPTSDAGSLPVQPELGFDFKSQVDGAALVLLDKIARAIDASGKRGDGFAADLDLDPAQLSRALRSRGAHFSVRWLPAVLWRDRDHTVVRFLAAMAGGEFIPKPKRTREDENEALRRYVEERMGDHGLDVIKHALGSDAP